MKIPRSKKDILVKTYLEYENYIKSLEEKYDEKDLIKNTIKIFYKINDDQYNSMPYSTILDMFKIIDNILKLPQKLVISFKHNGKKYAINPNFDDMTFGEYIDCDTNDIIRQICILYRPIKRKLFNKYTIEKYNADIKIYDELKDTLTLDVYYGFIGFFLKISKDIMKYTVNSMKEMDIDQDLKKSLEESGLGLDGFITSVAKI